MLILSQGVWHVSPAAPSVPLTFSVGDQPEQPHSLPAQLTVAAADVPEDEEDWTRLPLARVAMPGL